MRIVSVVTLVSPDGAYGGPVRVALNQARALMRHGHQVVVAGGYRGFDEPPEEIDGVPVRLFPARQLLPGTGFAGLVAPGMWVRLRRVLQGADVLHVHAARDLVTLPAVQLARRLGVPYVLQTHGMIDPSTHPLARPLDRWLTRPALRDAAATLYLTQVERDGLRTVGGSRLRLEHLINGVPPAVAAGPPPGAPEVLFLARLAQRKRPVMFVEMAHRLSGRFPDVSFALVGPDEGEAAAVAAMLHQGDGQVRMEGPLSPDQTLKRMTRAAVYVLPSVDEPFPMSVLEAMSLGRPVVVTESCGLAPSIAASGAGLVADHSLDGLVAAVERLLEDADFRARTGAAALAAARELFSMDLVTERLLALYRSAATSQVVH